MRSSYTFALSCLLLAGKALSVTPTQTIYDNDFVDPAMIRAANKTANGAGARQAVVAWAEKLASTGPWSVLNKTVLPPTGSKKDYMSWAPYFWPNCSNVHNTTVLAPEQVWVQCNYVGRDGQFNPDRLLVNDTSNFGAMADAVFYNTLAWTFTGNKKYSDNAANFLNVWFIDPITSMNPNLQYAQMQRGPKGQVGTHTGVLDLKTMSKITSALLVLREGKSTSWTTSQDNAMNTWITAYLKWLQTNPIGTEELAATNNHGTFAWNQIAALYIALGDLASAKNATLTYFNGLYMEQIQANGEQPLEAARTHPYHYRAYNLAAMIVNARIGDYLGQNFWRKPTKFGGNIQKALDVAMNAKLLPDGDGPASELYSSIAAVASIYGDPSGKYTKFLANADSSYPAQPWFLWNQPLSDSGLSAATSVSLSAASPSTTIVKATGATVSTGLTRIHFLLLLLGLLLAIGA